MTPASFKDAIGRIRHVGRLEAISFLFLLLVAMPMKYFADREEWVRVAGMIHGGLFILLLLLIAIAWLEKKLSLKLAALTVLAAVVPCGPFILDARLAKSEADAH